MILLRRFRKILLWFAFAALLATRWTPLEAQDPEDGGISLQARAGFDGYYKAEFGVPVQITVENRGAPVDGSLRIALNLASPTEQLVYDAPVNLPTQSKKRITLYLDIPRYVNQLEVVLLDSRGRAIHSTVTNRLNQLSQEDLLYGIISPDPGEFSFLEGVRAGRSKAAVAFVNLAELPEIAVAWNALDIVVLDDVDSGALTPEQLAAMRTWVEGGGQLVVTGGPGWQKTTAALGEILPVSVTGSESFADLPALAQAIALPFRDPGPYLVTISSLVSGELIFHQDGLPLLARRSIGRGHVFFLSLDPKLAPLLDWDGSERLWAEVAGQIAALPMWGRGIQNGYGAYSAVTSLPSLALPSVVQLILFSFAYVIVIGPVNYWILKRRHRSELAWATIPVLVVAFSSIAYFTGFRLKGNDTILNQMSVNFARVGSERMRVQTLLGLYSPRRGSYDLIFPADAMARPFERDFGGMSGAGNIDAVSRSQALTIHGVRVDVSGTETFVANGYRPALPVSGEATLNLNGNDVSLDVIVNNDSQFVLQNAALLIGSDLISLGDLAPGESRRESQIIHGLASTAGAIPAPGPGPVMVGAPGYASPLSYHAATLLGTSDYYNDREAFPRWQLLQAFEQDYYSSRGGAGPVLPTDVATLIAWTDQATLDIEIGSGEFAEFASALYFLEFPLTQQIVSGRDVTVPLPLLNWSVLDESGTYQASIQNLYLQGGYVEFEYQPWPEFQEMHVTQLAIAMVSQEPSMSMPLPLTRLWNWQQEAWQDVADMDWGVTPISRPARYIGPGNAVRIRLQSPGNYGSQIQEVYPVLRGDLQ